ncbi:sensor histidine kinase [Actinoplanes utahensis]|uniref:sensor histidine kinase n=1 Tax=Actinoplanes utahensis TaxID=1869 RepID=UPI00191BE865|nr:histidine kinase [Actinoplanes utahensis]GIF35216.1 two-component sensor histidine kinase [Actinoplanes utahensis]
MIATRLRAWSRTPVVRDLALAVLLVVLSAAPGTSGVWVALGELPLRPLDALGVVLVLAQSLPLVLRRSRPAICLAVVGLAFAVHQALGYSPAAAGLGLYVALGSAGSHLAQRRRMTAATAVAGYAVLAVVLHAAGSPASIVELLTFLPVLAAFWMAGAWVRARRNMLAALRSAEAVAAVAEERARIARELHDVVTHHVTAMVVQAEAMQYLVEREPEKVVIGLGVLGETGRSAMTDLRDLLGALHGAGESGRDPAVGSVADLVDRGRTAGLAIELHESGPAGTGPAGVELAVYRVVQESLTNAVKHAPGAGTVVHVNRGPEEITVAVTTTAAGRPRRGWTRSGRGLAGLKERVGFVGGRLVAGPEPDGGFAVRAWVPVGGDRRG